MTHVDGAIPSRHPIFHSVAIMKTNEKLLNLICQMADELSLICKEESDKSRDINFDKSENLRIGSDKLRAFSDENKGKYPHCFIKN